MAKRLTILFVLLMLLGGNALAGMPFGSRQSGMEAMPCCKKNQRMKHQESPKSADAVRLCCALNCSAPVPTAPPFAAQSSVSPVLSAIVLYSSILDSLLILQKNNQRQSAFFAAPLPVPRKFQPKYIQHHSFLI